MCPDNDKDPEDEKTEHRESAGPTPESSVPDPTIPIVTGADADDSAAEDADPDDVRTIADGDEPAATIAVPASHPTQATATGNAGAQGATGGSVPFTPVRDMTSGSLEKAKATAKGNTGRSAGHRFANRFEVVDVLGEGGMGKVFRVRDTHIDNREMALKVLRPKYSNNPQFRALFTKEIHAAQNFVSENVVQIRDTGQTEDNQLFLTMDMVDGEDLYELLKRESVLLPRHALEIIRQTLFGLHSGHEQGFIHRDIKPSNVMLATNVPKTDENPYGVGVQLLDFGIAGIAAEVSGQIAGTPMYMSPEQAQGQRLDPRSDLFTIGVMMFEMLSGTRPFEGKTLEQVTASLLETNVSEKIGELPQLGRPVQKILTKALQKDREKRYQSASEFVEAIEKSKAFRAPTSMSTGATTMLGVVLLAAVGQAAYIATAMGDTQGLQQEKSDLQAEMATLRSSHTTEKLEREKQYRVDLEAKEADFNEAKGLVDKKLLAVNEDLATSEARADNLAAENAKLIEQAVHKGDESVELVTDKKRQQTEINRLTEELAQLRDRERKRDALVAEQERQLNQLQQATRLESVTASGFDRLLVFLNRNSSESARRQLDTLQAKGIFSSTGNDGGNVLEEFVSVSETLDRYEQSLVDGAADPELLRTAEDGLVLVGTRMDDFQTASSLWIKESVGAAEAPDRLAVLQALLVSLETRLEQLTSSLASTTEAELEEILNGPPTQNPERAFQVASLGGSQFLPKVLQRCVKELTSSYDTGGGLDLARLKSLDCLTPWVEYLNAGENASKFDANQVANLKEFWAAQQWYFGENPDRQALKQAIPVPSINAPNPMTNWRGALAIQMGLYFEDSLPNPSGGLAVFLQTNLSNGSKSWVLLETKSQGGSGPEKSFDIDSTTFAIKKQGVGSGKNRKLNSSLSEWKFIESGKQVLNLLAPASEARVRTWSQVAIDWSTVGSGDLPRGAGFPSAEERDAFASSVASTKPLCVIAKEGNNTKWFSPTHGMVRWETGNITRELVYLRN